MDLFQYSNTPNPNFVGPKGRRVIDVDNLRELAAKPDISTGEIARQMGFTYDAVRRAANKNDVVFATERSVGSKVSPFWRENDARLTELVNNGSTASEAAKALGTSKGSVIARAVRLDLTWARSPHGGPPAERHNVEFPPKGCCVWPIGRPGDEHFHFCGERIAALGKPYCKKHHRKAWMPSNENNTTRSL